MSQPFDSALTLQSVSNIIREQYAPTVENQMYMKGAITSRLVQPDSEPVVGDGKTFQVLDGESWNARIGTDMLADFQSPTNFVAKKVKMRFNERTPASNDFSRIEGTCRVSQYEVDGVSSEKQALDIAKTQMRMLRSNVDMIHALHRNLDRTAAIVAVTNTPKKGDSHYMGGASSSPTTTMRCNINNGALGALQPNMQVDIYSSTGTLRVANAVVKDVNQADPSGPSVSFTCTAPSTFASVASTDLIYLSGQRNKGMYSFGAWFSRPASGDSFIGGVDRGASDYRFLLPTSTREGSTSKKIARQDFDDLANAMSYITDDDIEGCFIVTDPQMASTIRADIFEDILLTGEMTPAMGKRYANFGGLGTNYQHPIYGTIKLLADPLAVSNSVRFFVPQYWKSQSYGATGLHFMPGNMGQNSIWSRLPSSTPGQGGSMFYQAEAYMLRADWCYRPRLQGQILNVTAT